MTYKHLVNDGTTKVLACPSCGATDFFVEVGTCTYTSTIAYIDESGTVHWTGESEMADDMKHSHYQCHACDFEFDKEAFDPAQRIADALAGLDELTTELEE